MAQHNPHETYVYQVNGKDVIVSISANWQAFVDANGGTEKTSAANVLGKSLWDFVDGLEVQHLYKSVIKTVRKKKREAKVLFRCDSPDTRRFLRLTLVPLEKCGVEFRSQILRTEPRESVDLLRNDVERAKAFIKMCSMCKKVETRDERWEEAEAAINSLRLFEMECLPQISHGICPGCFQAVTEELDACEEAAKMR